MQTWLNLGTWFSLPKRSKEEEDKLRFPWFSDADIKKLYDKTAVITDEKLRKQAQDDLYRKVLPIIENEKKFNSRNAELNNLYYQAQQEKDPKQKTDIKLTTIMWELGNSIKSKFGLPADANDWEIITKFLQQVPKNIWLSQQETERLFQDYLNKWDEELLYVTWLKERAIEPKQMAKREQNFGNFVRWIFWKEELTSEEWNKARASWETKWLWEIMTKDFWAAPSVVVWAVESVPKTIWNIVKLINNEAGENFNDKVSNFISDGLWVEKDWWYKWWETVWQIWQQMTWLWALWKIKSVWQLYSLLWSSPRYAKIFAWIAWWATSTQLANIISEWEFATAWETAVWWALWWAFSALWQIGKWISKALKDNPLQQSAVKDVSTDYIDDIAAKTKEFKVNHLAPNPIKTLQKELDDIANTISSDRWAVWKEIQTIRQQLDDVPLWTVREDLMSKFNKNLADIANTKIIQKWKWISFTNVWPRVSPITSSAADKTLVKETLWLVKQAQKWMKASSIESLNTELKSLINASKASPTTKKALTEFSKEIMDEVDDIIKQSWLTQAKQRYGSIMKVREELASISSEWWSKWEQILRRLANREKWWEIIDLFDELKKLGYTTEDLYGKALTINYVMDSILWPNWFTKAFSQIYPSKPWMIEALIQTTKSSLINPVSEIRKFAKWYKPKDVYVPKILTPTFKWKVRLWDTKEVLNIAKKWLETTTYKWVSNLTSNR
jgi:hypothetical protein